MISLLRSCWLSLAGAIVAESTKFNERCVLGSKSLMLSTWLPMNSILRGNAQSGEKTSTIPPRRLTVPATSTIFSSSYPIACHLATSCSGSILVPTLKAWQDVINSSLDTVLLTAAKAELTIKGLRLSTDISRQRVKAARVRNLSAIVKTSDAEYSPAKKSISGKNCSRVEPGHEACS